jgi:hypothetical protein
VFPRGASFTEGRGVPEDAACLVAAGPKTPYSAREVEILETYIRGGGRLFLLLDPFQDGGFTDFLGRLGISLRDDAVVDPGGKIFGGDLLFPMAVEYPSHPVSRGIAGVCIFPVARSLPVQQPADPRIETRIVARPSPDAWAETDRPSLAAGRPVFDPADDGKGPVVLAASAEILAEYPDRDGAVLAVGDSDFAANTYVSAARNMSFLSRFPCLADRSRRNSGRPPRGAWSPSHQAYPRPGNFPRLAVLGFIPGAAALLGVRSWLKRRRGE